MTHTELERLAVLESRVEAIAADVTEIKVDVKSLLLSQGQNLGALDVITRAVPWLAFGIAAYAVFR